MKLYTYTFEDDSRITTVNCPLTSEEIFALERLHGECVSDTVEVENNGRPKNAPPVTVEPKMQAWWSTNNQTNISVMTGHEITNMSEMR